MAKMSDTGTTLADIKPFEHYPWATYLPGRDGGRRTYKRHQTLAHAKLAVNFVNGSNASGAEIYHWEEESNSWVLTFFVNDEKVLELVPS
jgi:hypothetical protein